MLCRDDRRVFFAAVSKPAAAPALSHIIPPICSPASMTKEAMSAIGTKRTSPSALHMSALGGKADMTFCTAHVCFLTQSGH